MKPKLILISSRADHGGGPAHMEMLAKRLIADFDLYFAVPKDKPYWDRFKALVGGSHMIPLPHRMFTLTALFRLISVIRSKKIDIIHSHGKGAGLYGRLAAIFAGKICIHTFHGVHIDHYSEPIRQLYLLYERLMALATDRIISVSQSEAKLIGDSGISKSPRLVTINNGVEQRNFSTDHHNPLDSFRIASTTRFDYAKNPELLAKIIESIFSIQKSKVEFHIIGDGEGAERFKERIKQYILTRQVVMHGYLTEPSTVLATCDCYLSTSRWEGLPLSILDACQCCLPILATKVRGNIDVIQDGFNGFLFESDCNEEAVSLISRLSVDINLCKTIGENGRAYVEQNYTAEKMAGSTRDLYLSLCGNPSLQKSD